MEAERHERAQHASSFVMRVRWAGSHRALRPNTRYLGTSNERTQQPLSTTTNSPRSSVRRHHGRLSCSFSGTGSSHVCWRCVCCGPGAVWGIDVAPPVIPAAAPPTAAPPPQLPPAPAPMRVRAPHGPGSMSTILKHEQGSKEPPSWMRVRVRLAEPDTGLRPILHLLRSELSR